MKVNTWQLIAIAGLILTAIILSNIFAPGAFATVVSVGTALVALFVEKAKETPTDPPDLKVLDGGASKPADGPK